jgi:hypothetical protein
MTSDDDFQVTTVVLRLKRLASTLLSFSNPITAAGEIAGIISELASILREVPGDPDLIEGYAKGFRDMAQALDLTTTDLSAAVTAGVPSVWRGPAADAAVAALKATRDLTGDAAPAMRHAARLLESYADTLRELKRALSGYREDVGEAVSELDSLWDIGGNLLDTLLPGGDGGLLDEIGKIVNAINGAIRVFERLGEAADTLRRGMRDVAGKARAGAIRSAHVSAFDAVRFANAAMSADLNEENGILTTAQLARAADRLGELSDADRARMQALLDNAGSEAERAYLLKALAAGHPVASVEQFGALIHGKSESWLRDQLALVNPADSGTVTVNGLELEQQSGTTCGSTSIMIARAMNDPLYALSLTTDASGNPLDAKDFQDRIRTEQERIHDSTNLIWPKPIGTPPWGMSNELNEHADSFGAQYDWRLVDDTHSGSVNPALDDAVGAVDAGYTVPVLIGDGYPAHYVLLVGHEGDDLIFYNPSGEMTRVKESDFRNGNMDALGFSHVQGVVTPS